MMNKTMTRGAMCAMLAAVLGTGCATTRITGDRLGDVGLLRPAAH
jgi:hypothetical protein